MIVLSIMQVVAYQSLKNTVNMYRIRITVLLNLFHLQRMAPISQKQIGHS